MAKKDKQPDRTNDKLTPRKDGRKWLRVSLDTTQYKRDERGAASELIFGLYDTDAFEGTISEVIEKLAVVRDYYENAGFRRVAIGEFASYEEGDEISLHGYRLETKKELAAKKRRSENAKKAAKKRVAGKKKSQEDRDRKEFERLKKKFGKD